MESKILEYPEKVLRSAVQDFERFWTSNGKFASYVAGTRVIPYVSKNLRKDFNGRLNRAGVNMCPLVVESFADRVPEVHGGGDVVPRLKTKYATAIDYVLSYGWCTLSRDSEGRLQVYKPGEVYISYDDDEVTALFAVFVKRESTTEGYRYTATVRDGSRAEVWSCERVSGGAIGSEEVLDWLPVVDESNDTELDVIDVGASVVGDGAKASRSVLDRMTDLQDALSYAFLALLSGTETYVRPIKQLTRYEPSIVQAPNGEFVEQPPTYDPRSNNIIGVKGEGEIKQLNAPDPGALEAVRKSWAESIAAVVGLPAYELVGTDSGASVASGTALNVLSRKRDSRSQRIGEAIAEGLNVLFSEGETSDELFTIGKIDDMTFSEKLADIPVMSELGLPKAEILRHLGYSEDRVESLLAEMDEERVMSATVANPVARVGLVDNG